VTTAVSTSPPSARPSARGAAWLASVALCGLLPAIVVVTLFAAAISDELIAVDLRQFYWAAEQILDGESPYLPAGEPLLPRGGPYPYPPLPALAAVPLTALPFELAGLIVMASLVAAALATLRVLDVRDWRCYGVVLLWPPVISAIQTGNVTLWFGLALAIVWRFRDRLAPAATALGLTLAVKFFLWPIAVWLAATRRVATALVAVLLGALLLVASWVPLGFAGFLDYPDLLRRLDDAVGADSYTLYILALDLGVPSTVARAIWLAAGLAVLALVVVLARRGDERTAFVVAIGACLSLKPIVWLHYFALLLVVVALARPRLGVIWPVPLLMVVTPGDGQPTSFETAFTLAVACAIFVLAVRATRARARTDEHTSPDAGERGFSAPVGTTTSSS
jgi:hypothetical protein